MKWDDYMKAWNSVKNDCDHCVKNEIYQETGKECSTIVQMIAKDDCRKAIVRHSVICKMTCYYISLSCNFMN